MNKTKIEWADYTWNPVTGCRHGCPYCYARRDANRFGKMLQDRSGYPEAHSGLHCLENKIDGNPYPYIFEPTFQRFRLGEPAQVQTPQSIFVCSMSDLFGDWVPDEWIEEVFAACERAPQHTYIFLTKNPDRYLDLEDAGKLPIRDNMWYGSTVTFDYPDDSPEYCVSSQVANTFLSIEPLLGMPTSYNFWFLKCVIIGPETGNRKGKVIPKKEWVNAICERADADGASVFMKDKLASIVGEENMRRELPWEVKEKQK